MTECSPLEALTEAETACANKLKSIIDSKTFISRNPGLMDCNVFDIGHLQTGELTLFPSRTYHFRAFLDVYRRDRTALQQSIMRLLLSLPIGADYGKDDDLRESSNVVVFRIAPYSAAISDISVVDVETSNNNTKARAYVATVQFDVVFVARFE